MHAGTRLLLASNSPRRRQLLSLGGWKFSLFASDVDESRREGEPPAEYVLRLAEEKARAAAIHADGEEIILGADTAVVDGDEILGKPADAEEAARFLRQLRGRVHQVYTGIAALRLNNGNLAADLCVTDVPMRDYSEEEIEAYVRTGDPLDKAGAYAIQHPVFRPVPALTGCYASVMGLPMCHVTRLLRRLEIVPARDVPAGCQASLEYSCPVFRAILRGEQAG